MYLPRIQQDILTDLLATNGAVIIEGVKACGKTVLARQVAESEVLLDVDAAARQAIAVDPKRVLEGDVPRLIDEWQIEPAIWNHVRRAVDDRGEAGQFILTGSAVPPDDITRHTGAGRISRLHLRPMSLLETKHSTGEISLQDLLSGRFSGCSDTQLKFEDVIDQLCRGGWPGNFGKSQQASLRAQRDYLREIQRADIVRVDGVRRDPVKVDRVLRSLARNSATTVSVRTMAVDAGGADGALDSSTVRDYLNALERLMIYEEQPAWSSHFRSRATLRKSSKRHFVDPSLAVAALRLTPQRLRKDLNGLGSLFESMVHKELSIYSDVCDASVYHYQDSTGLEVDAIVDDHQGAWCAFEVKLSVGQIDQAARTLLKFWDRIDTGRAGEPRMLAVIVSSGYGYLRNDGVAVIPIGALGP